MTDKIIDSVHWVLQQYKAIAIIVILLMVAFPLITTGVMWAERIGYFGSVYQVEHSVLQGLATEQMDLSRQTLAVHHALMHEVITNQGLIQSGNYFQQRTCVNTATTTDEKGKCLLKPWDRN